jgi:predicted transcriptional regulator
LQLELDQAQIKLKRNRKEVLSKISAVLKDVEKTKHSIEKIVRVVILNEIRKTKREKTVCKVKCRQSWRFPSFQIGWR